MFVSLVKQSEEGSKTEHLQAQRCRARLDHLDGVDIDNQSEWNNMRVKRILVDYMLRLSYYDSAVKLAESSNIQVILLSTLFMLMFFFSPLSSIVKEFDMFSLFDKLFMYEFIFLYSFNL